ncbi:arylsulfatase B-like [Rhipicephalus sanguineus]|uniref:arylsulfatase B-like n=1 Tax=Rhipicephalus sanguineus TaxID=34632 RepID=UPI0020C1E28C|nr:arylsulfatase B-like [Rhipicephalus sanguineus]
MCPPRHLATAARLRYDCNVAQGWADTSLVGGYQIPTPNLDALAAHGVLLTQHYTMQTCTPSRAALLTGLYPIRMGLQHAVLLPAQPDGMNLSVPTLAERLRDLGYKTHALGKWHLGYSSIDYTPRRRGFDTFFGYYNTAKYYYFHGLNFNNKCGRDFWDDEELVKDADGVYDTDLVTDRAVDIITRHDRDKPLFMYMATLAAHGETTTLTTAAPEKNLAKFPYIGDRNRTLLAGTVDALDEAIGRIVEALHTRGMLANSVIVFTSDNGGVPWGVYSNTGSNWPLRGVKGTLWEGGVRVPAVVWSPLLRPGSRVVLPRLAHLVDWLPTLYSAAGGNVSDLGTIDGLDLWPALSTAKSHSTVTWPRSEFLINIDTASGLSGYRHATSHYSNTSPYQVACRSLKAEEAAEEDLDRLMKSSLAWKTLEELYRDGPCCADVSVGWRQKAAVRCSPQQNISQSGFKLRSEGHYLFDVESDPCELYDLASTLPSVVDRLAKKMESYTEVAAPPKPLIMDPMGEPSVNDCVWAPWSVWAPWKQYAQTTNRCCPCP